VTTQNQTRNTGGSPQERRPRWPMGTTTVTGTTPPKAPAARATVGSGSPPDSGGPRIEYVPREDATPEGELAALAAVYALVIQAHERNIVAAPVNESQKEVNSEERRQGQDQ
jgi:hypothetical protein